MIAADLQVTQVCQVEDGVPGDLAKDGVLPVQLLCCIQGDEELAAVAVWDNRITRGLTSTCQQPSAEHNAPGLSTVFLRGNVVNVVTVLNTLEQVNAEEVQL